MPTLHPTTAPRAALSVAPVVRPPAVLRAAVTPAELERTLRDLYRQQLRTHPADPYLTAHARPHVVAGQVRAFGRYSPYLPAGGAVLDWGCNHAPDAALIRAAYGDRFELHGCDFPARAGYEAFHRAAGLTFRPLADVLKLPYPAGRFDAVVASGTLEHVAMDGESLKELYRVMKPGSVLAVSYLPNRLSAAEWRDRVLGRPHHRRLYGLREAADLLLRHGFEPAEAGYQTGLWDRVPRRLAAVGRRLLPVQAFASTVYLIAHKRESL